MHHHHAIALLVFSILFAAFAILTICAFAPKMQHHEAEFEAVRANGARMSALAALPIRRRSLYFDDQDGRPVKESPSESQSQSEDELPSRFQTLALRTSSKVASRAGSGNDLSAEEGQQSDTVTTVTPNLRQRHQRHLSVRLSSASSSRFPLSRRKKRVIIDLKLAKKRASDGGLMRGFIIDDEHPHHHNHGSDRHVRYEKAPMTTQNVDELYLDQTQSRPFRPKSTDWTAAKSHHRPVYYLGQGKEDDDGQRVQKILDDVLSVNDKATRSTNLDEDRDRRLEATVFRHRRPRWYPHRREDDEGSDRTD